MTYRADDERDILEGFIEFLAAHDWIPAADFKKRKYLVEEFLKDREISQENWKRTNKEE